MRIKAISIDQLFGGSQQYNLNLLSPNGVTILHAQNGMGKTTVLSMIPAILSGNIKYLSSTPFKSASIVLEDDTVIRVEKSNVFGDFFEEDEDEEELPFDYDEVDTSVEKKRSGKNEIKYTIIPSDGKGLDCKVSRKSIERLVHYAEMNSDVNLQMRRRLPIQLFENKEFVELFSSIISKLSVNFIKADRLYMSGSEVRRYRGRRLTSEQREREGDIKVEAILECALDLRERIYSEKRHKEDISEVLDRSFPKRVIELYKNKKVIDEKLIRDQLLELEHTRNELEIIGLVGDEKERVTFSSDEEFPPEALPVLEIYIDDNRKKLQAYDKLKKQIDLLLKAINVSNAFTNKKLEIVTSGSRYAMKFISDDGRDIPLEKLSSGEKHAVILFYNMIFNSKEGSLVMIDEPEISLHISWQQHFITSLLEICKENGLYAVVATHSPDIVGKHWDLLVNLDGTPVSSDSDEEE